ncbi:hypothetical protein Hdeb2414_s0022g00611941 [Helianthus debilis subsp. tardiflorus]
MSNDNRTNLDHRRSVAACLVQGVYILERDRQASEALAPPWWNFFQFDLHSQLIDDAYSCIFGAIRIASSFLTAVNAKIKNANQQRSNTLEDSFLALAGWAPCLFVNPMDHICSEYIGYFEHRKKMEEIGAGGIERLATQHSISGVFLNAIGK